MERSHATGSDYYHDDIGDSPICKCA